MIKRIQNNNKFTEYSLFLLIFKNTVLKHYQFLNSNSHFEQSLFGKQSRFKNKLRKWT